MSVHLADCMCPTCLCADMDETAIANGWNVVLTEQAPEPVKNRRNLKAGQRVGNGTVRTISIAQQNLIKKLIAERDTSGINLLPGQTLNIAEIPTMGVPGAHGLIDKLFNAPYKPGRSSVRMATEGQIKYITSLNTQAGSILSDSDIKAITFADVNKTLDMLKAAIKSKPVVIAKEITEGAYWFDGKIARVQRSKQGRLYATIQVTENVNEFEYVRGLITKLDADNKLSRAEMKAFAAEFHQCGDCGRRLTNPESIEYGIGPICRNKGYN